MAAKLKINGVEYDELLTPAEVAQALRVNAATVTRWHKQNLWPAGAVVKTLGGHRRYSAAVVAQMLADESAS